MVETNYTLGSNLSEMNDEQLIASIEFKKDECRKIYLKFKEMIKEVIDTFLPSWSIEVFSKDTLRIVRPTDKRRLDIDIYHGFDMFNDNEFRFDINPSSVGTFKINTVTNEGEYYKAIGTILSNTNLKVTLYTHLLEFAKQYKEPYESLQVLNSEEKTRARNIKIAKQKEDLAKFTEELKPSFKDAKKLKDDLHTQLYTIIQNTAISGEYCNATYYGRNVNVVSPALNYNDCWEYKVENELAGDMVLAHRIKFTI